jgi:hypothetical protein
MLFIMLCAGQGNTDPISPESAILQCKMFSCQANVFHIGACGDTASLNGSAADRLRICMELMQRSTSDTLTQDSKSAAFPVGKLFSP